MSSFSSWPIKTKEQRARKRIMEKREKKRRQDLLKARNSPFQKYVQFFKCLVQWLFSNVMIIIFFCSSVWFVLSKVHLVSAYSGAKQVFLHFSLVLNSVTLGWYKIREILWPENFSAKNGTDRSTPFPGIINLFILPRKTLDFYFCTALGGLQNHMRSATAARFVPLCFMLLVNIL